MNKVQALELVIARAREHVDEYGTQASVDELEAAIALLKAYQPAPTETGPKLDTSLMTEEGRRAWEAAPLAVEQKPQEQ